jgi:hypothetical protein
MLFSRNLALAHFPDGTPLIGTAVFSLRRRSYLQTPTGVAERKFACSELPNHQPTHFYANVFSLVTV